MSHSTWRSKLQTDAQNVTHTTRLTSLLIKRTLLHIWLTAKAVWRFGILRALLLLPLWFGRMLFFPLQWPLCMLGRALSGAGRWITDTALASLGRGLRALVIVPAQWISTLARNAWNGVCDRGDRCRRQYRELCELGFVNALALMPFLILRLIQGLLTTLFEGIRAILLGIGRAIAACARSAWAGVLWVVGCVSLAGCWMWMKQAGAEIGSRLADSPLVAWTRTSAPALARFGRSVSRRRLPLAAGWLAVSRSFRQNTAWALATVTGTLGLILLLYLQLSLPRPVAGETGSPTVAINPASRIDRPASAVPQQTEPLPEPLPFIETEPRIGEIQSEPDASPPGLELTLGWVEHRLSFDQLPGNQFEVSSISAPLTAVDDWPAIAADNSGWRKMQPRPAETLPATPPPADRLPLAAADLIVPAGDVAETPIAVNAESSDNELNVAVWREFPVQTAVWEVMSYRIFVRNHGSRTVDRVTIEERIPSGHRVVGASSAGIARDGRIIWHIGNLEPDEKRALVVEVMPTVAGAATTVATVKPVATVVARTDVSQPVAPELEPLPESEPPLEPAPVEEPTPFDPAPVEPAPSEPPPADAWELAISAPFQVASGKPCGVQFQVTNHGDRRADGVILRAVLPDGLVHSKGYSLDYPLGSLAAGETRLVTLNSRAAAVGRGRLAARVLVGRTPVEAADAVVDIVQSADLPRSPRRGRPCPCPP